MDAGDRPIGDDEFAALFEVDATRPIALAVSGGPDSLALLHLADRWSRPFQPRAPLIVLTVDHGLRPTSAQEAADVAAVAAARGLQHRTLVWRGEKPGTGIEAAARAARHRLLAEAMRAAGATVLVTAHHEEDQAETVLMRLARGSGLSGLGGMSRFSQLSDDGITIFRPFLSIPKARLVATVRASGLSAAVDETNSDPRFARARLRQLAPSLAEEGLGPGAVARMAAMIRRADDALSAVASRFIRENVAVGALATVRLPRAILRAQPEEIRLRVYAEIIAAVGTSDRRASAAQLESLDALATAPGSFRRTLGGAVVRTKGDELWAYREPGRSAAPEVPVAEWLEAIAPHERGVWDRRFRVFPGEDHEGLTIGPLGEEGFLELPPNLRPRPRGVALTLAAFRRHGRLVAVPSAGFALPGEGDIAVHSLGLGLIPPRWSQRSRPAAGNLLHDSE